MKLRKKILLAGCGILFVIALFQCVASSNNSIKTLKLEKDYNEITIQNSTETIVLQKQADQNWTVSKNQYAVNDAEFDSILDALQNLQLLEKVATASSDDVKEKYDLIEGKVITVTVKNADKVIRTVNVGKASSTNYQTYITVDDSKDIYLANGNLNSLFATTTDALRSKVITEFDADKIASIQITKADSDWNLSKVQDGETFVWQLTGVPGSVEVDLENANAWVKSFETFVASSWIPNNKLPEGTKELTCTVKTDTETVTFDVYSNPPVAEGESPQYFGTCSACEYVFNLPSYTFSRFNKDPSTFAK